MSCSVEKKSRAVHMSYPNASSVSMPSGYTWPCMRVSSLRMATSRSALQFLSSGKATQEVSRPLYCAIAQLGVPAAWPGPTSAALCSDIPSSISTRAETVNSSACWKPKNAGGHGPCVRMPHSRLRHGLSRGLPQPPRVPEPFQLPLAFQPARLTPARHGRCDTQSSTSVEKYVGYAGLPVACQAASIVVKLLWRLRQFMNSGSDFGPL